VVDLSPRCQPVADVQHPAGQNWCPDYHALVMVPEADAWLPSDWQSQQAAAIGAAAILIPWLWGRVARLVSALIEGTTRT
jgi:hypothetical protein